MSRSSPHGRVYGVSYTARPRAQLEKCATYLPTPPDRLPPTLNPIHPTRNTLLGGHQLMRPIPDHVLPPHRLQRIAEQRPVLLIVIAQERLLHPSLLDLLHDAHTLALIAHLLQRV